jgi:hypothetical protein
MIFRTHAIQRMFKRGISVEDVRHVLLTGEVIEDYPGDYPYPSRLVLGWRGTRPIHVVAAYNIEGDESIIIAAYEPDPAQWDTDFSRRL